MKTEKTVTVIVPCYNMERTLERALDSLLANDLTDGEVIAVDDGSTDQTPHILRRYAQEHACIRVITKRNGGLSSARNAGLDVATGRIIMFMDSDDTVEPTFVSTAVRAMDAPTGRTSSLSASTSTGAAPSPRPAPKGVRTARQCCARTSPSSWATPPASLTTGSAPAAKARGSRGGCPAALSATTSSGATTCVFRPTSPPARTRCSSPPTRSMHEPCATSPKCPTTTTSNPPASTCRTSAAATWPKACKTKSTCSKSGCAWLPSIVSSCPLMPGRSMSAHACSARCNWVYSRRGASGATPTSTPTPTSPKSKPALTVCRFLNGQWGGKTPLTCLFAQTRAA